MKFAHRTFPWTSEAGGAAAVMCVILGFTKQEAPARLFDYPHPKGQSRCAQSQRQPYLVNGPAVLVTPQRSGPLSRSLPSIDAGSTPIDWDNFTVEDEDLTAICQDPYASKYLSGTWEARN